MYQWRIHQSVACPYCRAEPETIAHIMQCPDQAAQAIGDQNILELRTLVKESETDPAIIKDLSTGVNTWRQNKQPPQCLPNWANYKHLYPGTIFAMGSWQSLWQCTTLITTQIGS